MVRGSQGRAPTNQAGEASHSSGPQGQSTPETAAGNQTRVLELIEEVVGLVRQQRQQPQQPIQQVVDPPEQRRSIAEFKRMAPSVFKGTTSPQEAEAWIDEMEKAFRAMECTDEEKVRFATYMLQDRAHHWWMSVERTLASEQEALTWQRFRTAFYSKYFPSSRLRELEREFLNLSQGTMTVDEYEAEFDRAKNMEIVWKETQDSKDRIQKKRSRDDDTHSGQNSGRTAKFHNRSEQSEKQRSYGETIQQEKLKCEACGGAHKTELCRRLSGACFKCGQQGHRIKECPYNQQDSQSVQRPQTTRTQQVQASPTPAQSAQPSSSKQQIGGRPYTQGRIYALTQHDAQASNTVVSGTLPVASVYAYILIDSGATHSLCHRYLCENMTYLVCR
ncbi:uncharacterized protein LOC120112563 [Phoenix dactylifera]|uniref:Uncharacterized protein LOC120112563 n=1 Tax=Phoenix dactylifera TaxID=42345 RepID=A0A8B9AXE5_PHODC|nr:uncharacterized protein LOC120112563 [Phoenix dactylifera]